MSILATAAIHGALLAPMNIQKQNTINEHGRIIEKDGLTHDQSYKWPLGTSVNSRVITEELLPCMFGACIKRVVNWAVSARQKFPKSPILASKFDFKSAFRWCHLNAASAAQNCNQIVEINILLMMLRLSFGGKPCPFEWDVISESICNLANMILHDDSWDPYDLTAPNQHLVPEQTLLDDSIPFGQGLELIVDIPINPREMHDIYIDDVINLTINIPSTDHVARAKGAALLAMDSTAHPNHPEEPMPRKSMDARDKLRAEARPAESVILGWDFDIRRLIISLLKNKFVAWTRNISQLLLNGTTTAKELKSTIGCLGHLTLVVPGVHNFLSRLRDLQQMGTHRPSIKISKTCRNNLILMICFLEISKRVIDMNLIAFRRPTHVYWSDSCPFGLGGYLDEGFAWRFELPKELRYRASNNLLKYIASIISPWINMLAGHLD
jgi:hypothetical protein